MNTHTKNTAPAQNEPLPKKQEGDGGLYKNLNVSTRTLNLVIIGGILLIVLIVFYAGSHSGYTVSYNSKGGSDVASQSYGYQQSIELPEAPQREGYTFTGWYLDETCTQKVEADLAVEGSMELYACWAEK